MLDDRAHFNHRGCGRVSTEALAVCLAELSPARDVRYEETGAHDATEIRAQFGKGALNNFEATPRLGVAVARREDPTVITNRRGAGNVDVVTGAQGTAVANLGFPGGKGVGTVESFAHRAGTEN